MDIRSKKTKEEFIQYLKDHPQERFWQSVRNFSGYYFIYAGGAIPDEGIEDTFYKEEK